MFIQGDTSIPDSRLILPSVLYFLHFDQGGCREELQTKCVEQGSRQFGQSCPEYKKSTTESTSGGRITHIWFIDC